jgi:hypothetical protein
MNGFTTADHWFPTFAKLHVDTHVPFIDMAGIQNIRGTMFPRGPTTDRFLLEGDESGKFVLRAVFHHEGIRGNYLMYGKAMSDPSSGTCYSIPGFQAFKANRSTEGNWFKQNKANYEFQLIWDWTPGNVDKYFLQGTGWALVKSKTFSGIASNFIRPDRLIDSMRFPSGYKNSARTGLCSGGKVLPDGWSGLPAGLKGSAGVSEDAAVFDYRFEIKPYAHRTGLVLDQSLWWSELLETGAFRFGVDVKKSTVYLLDRRTKKLVWEQVLQIKFSASTKPLLIGDSSPVVTFTSNQLLVCGFDGERCVPFFVFATKDLTPKARLVMSAGALKVIDNGRTVVSFPNEKNVELLSDPGVELDDFNEGQTRWQDRFAGYCQASQLGSTDGEGTPQEGLLFAKVVKSNAECKSVYSDAEQPRLMILGDVYRFTVHVRLPPGQPGPFKVQFIATPATNIEIGACCNLDVQWRQLFQWLPG